MDLRELTAEMISVARKAGDFITGESGKFSSADVHAKGVQNYVTYVDTTAEKILTGELKSLLPEAGFIAEEGTASGKGSRYNWIVDPLDGTTNYIHNLPPYAISIALADGERIVSGVIYEMGFRDIFHAWEGGDAFMNGEKIRVSDTKRVEDSLIATGFPYTNFSQMKSFMKSMDHFMRNSHGLRRFGSAATDLAYVACGRFDAFYEYGLNPWDVAAGSLIIRQAGGRIDDFRGNGEYLYGKEIVASNERIFSEFSGIIREIMGGKQ